MKKVLLSALFSMALVSSLMAISKTYTIGTGSSVTANSSDPGLVIQTQLKSGLAGTSFALDDGQTKTLDFFRIWTNETTVNADDKVAKQITAFLDFSVPDVTAENGGLTYGYSSLFGIIQGGKVTWSGPDYITTNDRKFKVWLDDTCFSVGSFGLNNSYCAGADVDVHIRQCTSQQVPDASMSISLLGLSLLSLAGLGRFLRRC